MRVSATRSVRPFAAIAAAAIGIVSFACSGESGGATAGEERTVHGTVSVERSINLGQDALGRDASSATSAARFIEAPDNGAADGLLALAGLTEELPAVGTCRTGGVTVDEAAVAGTAFDTVELLDAGNVAIDADGAVRLLAPHAFPDVSGYVSGVMYTSRDRAEAALPANVRYTVTTSGSPSLPALSLSAAAPRDLEQVTLGGVPLGELREVSLDTPVDLTWGVGEPDDRVYAELSVGESTLICSFRDDTGNGSISALDLGRLGAAGAAENGATREARVALHRLRVVDYQGTRDAQLRGAQLRFDFELTRSVLIRH